MVCVREYPYLVFKPHTVCTNENASYAVHLPGSMYCDVLSGSVMGIMGKQEMHHGSFRHLLSTSNIAILQKKKKTHQVYTKMQITIRIFRL